MNELPLYVTTDEIHLRVAEKGRQIGSDLGRDARFTAVRVNNVGTLQVWLCQSGEMLTVVWCQYVVIQADHRIFRQGFMNDLNYWTNSTFTYVIANRWIGIRLDIICCIFISFICFSLVLLKDSLNAALLVMSLQISVDVISLFSFSFRMKAELENDMTSSQRMIDYTKLDLEGDLVKPDDQQLERKCWPVQGQIEFIEATMRYRNELEPSILNLSFKAQAGMLVGIVGRTGSGKSSILQTLFRLVEL